MLYMIIHKDKYICIFVSAITGVKLVNATSSNPGLVQMEYKGEWYLICASHDYAREALVMCRQLGYRGGWQQDLTAKSPVVIGFDHCNGMLLFPMLKVQALSIRLMKAVMFYYNFSPGSTCQTTIIFGTMRNCCCCCCCFLIHSSAASKCFT